MIEVMLENWDERVLRGRILQTLTFMWAGYLLQNSSYMQTDMNIKSTFVTFHVTR